MVFRGVALAEGGCSNEEPCPASDSGPQVVIWSLCTVSREERWLVIFSYAAHTRNAVPLLHRAVCREAVELSSPRSPSGDPAPRNIHDAAI